MHYVVAPRAVRKYGSFIIRTPKEKLLLPKPSVSDQNLPDPNTCEDSELAHAINVLSNLWVVLKMGGTYSGWDSNWVCRGAPISPNINATHYLRPVQYVSDPR